MPQPVLLEVCVASVEDALAAVAGGVDRLEVNCALELGGLTPSSGLFAEVRRRVQVPMIAMVRPRPGGFCYSDADFDVMLRDAKALLDTGADGLAFGILTPDGRVDRERCRTLRDRCDGRDAVFHRAFDVTPDPVKALETLIDLGFTRVMTSGQAETAVQGTELIGELIRRAGGRIEVLPASGINARTAPALIARTGCDQVHASVRTAVIDPSVAARPVIRLGADGNGYYRTDPQAVAQLRAALSGPAGPADIG
jgi:copper homeostasis protein